MRPGRPLAAALFAAAAVLVAPPAHADVLTIGDDGAVTRQSGPALFLTPDMVPQPIAGAAPPAPSAQRGAAPPEAIGGLIRAASARAAISPLLLEAVAWRESRFDPAAVSSKGARGVMQLMPATARELGVDPDDAAANIAGGAEYLRRMLRRYGGDLALALAAYNAGPAAVDRFGGVPPFPETRAYVGAVLSRMSAAAHVDLETARIPP